MSEAAGGTGARRAGGFGRWLAGRTLRGRLIAGLLALLAVACACVGIVTYLALRGALLDQLDSQLTAASQRYLNCVQPPAGQGGDPAGSPGSGAPGGNPQDCADAPGQAQYTLSATLTGGAVRYPATPTGPCRLSVAADVALAALPYDGKPYTATLSRLGTYRLMAVRGPGNAVYISGLPVSSMTATLHNVELTEIVVFSAALLPNRVPDADPRTEVGQLGVAFNRMLGHVESALARRHASEARLRGFAADASHELRTPLAAIRGYAELARRHPGALPDDVAHALSRVESESARMSGLVDDLLLLARLDAGRPLADDLVDLTRLAIDAASDARAAAPDHRWQLDLPGESVVVRGDEHRLRQVLANLMSNAARHTPPGTTVTISLAMPGSEGSAAGPAGMAAPRVGDDGPGIPPELQPELFERFVRGDSSRSRAAGSTGLGLAIVDAVVAAHRGHVQVTSRPGQTVFVITLPLPAAGSSSPGPS